MAALLVVVVVVVAAALVAAGVMSTAMAEHTVDETCASPTLRLIDEALHTDCETHRLRHVLELERRMLGVWTNMGLTSAADERFVRQQRRVAELETRLLAAQDALKELTLKLYGPGNLPQQPTKNARPAMETMEIVKGFARLVRRTASGGAVAPAFGAVAGMDWCGPPSPETAKAQEEALARSKDDLAYIVDKVLNA